MVVIIGWIKSEYNGKQYQIVITPFNTPLDIDEIAYLIANPTANRRLAFAFLEKETRQGYCGGYGGVKESYDDEDFIFPSISLSHKSWASIASAKQNIVDAIRQHNENPGTPVML